MIDWMITRDVCRNQEKHTIERLAAKERQKLSGDAIDRLTPDIPQWQDFQLDQLAFLTHLPPPHKPADMIQCTRSLLEGGVG